MFKNVVDIVSVIKSNFFVLMFALSAFLVAHAESNDKKYIIKEYTLNKHIRKKFELMVNDISIDPYKAPDEYTVLAGEKLEKLLPDEIKKEIRKMNSHEGPDLIIIHNFPVDSSIPETPRDGKRPLANTKGFVSEAAMLSIGYLLNVKPFYKRADKDETVINQIIPINTDKYENQFSSFGSKLELLPHTENAYERNPLKYFSLLCLRGDPKVATNLIFFDDVLLYVEENHPDRSEWLRNIISKPLFIMASGAYKKSIEETMQPILEFKENGGTILHLNLNPRRTVGATTETEHAITLLREIITSYKFRREYYKKIYLSSGDYILFKNWKVLHSRDAFPIDIMNWRWLQRCYFNPEL